MKRKNIISALVLTGSIGLGAHPVLAQAAPGGGAAGGTMGGAHGGAPAQTGPTIPQPNPGAPMQTQPTIPGQPAPRSPGQTDQVVPADPRAPGAPGQSSQPRQDLPGQAPASGLAGPTDRVIPGQQGTIPEVIGRPEGTIQGGRTATASRDDIRRAQEALRAQGHNPGSMDGNMDNRTQQALRDFQQANKLPVTGTLDQQTAARLGINLNSGASTPQREQGHSVPQGTETAPGKRAVQ